MGCAASKADPIASYESSLPPGRRWDWSTVRLLKKNQTSDRLGFLLARKSWCHTTGRAKKGAKKNLKGFLLVKETLFAASAKKSIGKYPVARTASSFLFPKLSPRRLLLPWGVSFFATQVVVCGHGRLLSFARPLSRQTTTAVRKHVVARSAPNHFTITAPKSDDAAPEWVSCEQDQQH